ncbi:alpha,alpha-trehalase TreF [Aquisalinus flavus]|uniref:alpha,alpha-trehalase TreF n=1 Tax=Aquisalinus flavus TaxID=1526572 RepID=UPI0019D6E427|nr:alpha,alpha-trehalase TreF [Aquisalinus flavus]
MILAACETQGPPAPGEPAASAAPVPAIATEKKTEPPSQLFPALFQTVAQAELYPAKDWVDALPFEDPAIIMAAWEERQPASRLEISVFVAEFFELPGEATTSLAPGGNKSMRAHIESLWPELTHDAVRAERWSSLLSLPEPYIVPGGRFREVYYWDAYFTMTGMGPEHDAIKRSMVDNFAGLIDAYGFIPNANRTYYLSRSQPPFFFKMVGLLTPNDPVYSWAEYLPQLKAEHAFWMNGAGALAPGTAAERVVRLADGALLSRYWDDLSIPRDESYLADVLTAQEASRPKEIVYRNLRAGAESGWDFSSRWFAGEDLSSIETTDIIPPDLNAILYGLETAIAAACARKGDRACEADYRQMADARSDAMRHYLWNDDTGAYDDYDFVDGTPRGNITAAALYPLFFGLASQAEADATALMIEEELLAPGGLLTTPNETGEQWDAPNGWAPLHWIAVQGLADYGHTDLSRTIARRWLQTVARTYCQTGKMVEKYDVTEPRPGGGGEYPTQDGFGWTNGVTIALMDRYQEFMPYGDVTVDSAADHGAENTGLMQRCEAAVARAGSDL